MLKVFSIETKQVQTHRIRQIVISIFRYKQFICAKEPANGLIYFKFGLK